MRSNGRIDNIRDEFMHPDGSLGLVFNWGDVLQLQTRCYPQDVVIDRVGTRSQRLQLAGQVETFGILFRPGGAFPLFGVPMDELTETAVLADHLPQHQLTHLHEQLYALPTLAARAALVERWLLAHVAYAQEQSPLVNTSLAILAQTHGQRSIQQVAESVYVSTRQLERLFKTEVGLSPKKFARLMRIRQARVTLKQDGTLTHVAHTHGFYDQAHFIREFSSVIGMTPGAYLSRQKNSVFSQVKR